MRTAEASAPEILAYARAGSIDLAWALFVSSGLAGQSGDPAIATLKGRLLKDRAARAVGEEARRLLAEAAAAYQHAADLTSATYPRINAATLSLLGGDIQASREGASRILADIEAHPDEPETPYYRMATRAEALLLMGRWDEARDALAEAIALAPRAWEDHATTLRQFGLILDANGKDASWLASHRPPRSLHFGGHMSFDPRVTRRDPLEQAISSILEQERVGFGYGALAAGADIVIAEILIDRGAELHVVLPGGTEAFAARSVRPFGDAWHARFDALLQRAETVRAVPPAEIPPGDGMIGLANEVAMGLAAMNARRLESEAVQLLVVDPADLHATGDGITAGAGDIWLRSGRRQRQVEAPREEVGMPPHHPPTPDDRRTLAVLAIMPALHGNEDPGSVARRLEALHALIGQGQAPAIAPLWDGVCVLLAHVRVADAAAEAMRLASEGYRVGAHYAATIPFRDPFSGAQRLTSDAIGAAQAACASTPDGSACVTEDFAASLSAHGSGGIVCSFVGELDPSNGGAPVALYALRQ